MSLSHNALYQFGEFQLDAGRRLLLREGEPVVIAPKVYEVLLALVETQGQPLSKDDLLSRVWPDTIVEESNLTVSVSALRRVLGERRGEQKYIATIPGVGYKFVAPVSQPPINQTAADSALTITSPQLPTPPLVTQPITPSATEPATQPTAQPTALLIERQTVSQVVVEVEEERLASRALTEQRARARRRIWLASGAVAVLSLLGLLVFILRGRPPVTSSQVRSMAVLPFTLLQSKEQEEALGLGLADALITRLSNSSGLAVRPTGAIQQYISTPRDAGSIGRQLGVEAVLDGRVQQVGNQLRLTVQLIRADDGTALWAESFDMQFTDLLTVQQVISERVAHALTLQLTSEQTRRLKKQYTANPAAFQAYFKGRYRWSRRTPADLKQAIVFFQQAIDLDPTYALAWSGLADTYVLNSSGLPALERLPKARAAVERALELDDQLAEPHAARGLIKFKFDFDVPGAEADFKRAIELNPNYATVYHWYGDCLSRLDRFDEALRLMRQAEALDPLALAIKEDIGTIYYRMRHYDEAIKRYREVLAVDPGYTRTVGVLAYAYAAQKRYDEAIAAHLKEQEMSHESSERISALKQAYQQGGWQGYWRKYLEYVGERPGKAYYTARLYLRIGDKARAYQFLDQSFDDHSGIQGDIKNDPEMDSLRAEPRFQALLRRCGFTP